MAYGSWHDVSTKVKGGTNYDIYLQWRWRTDTVANKSQVQTQFLEVKSKNGTAFSADTVTFGAYPQGESYSPLSTGSFSISANSAKQLNTADKLVTVSHSSDGSFPSRKIYWYLKSTYTPNGFPSYTQSSWQDFRISGIPKIDRSAPVAKIESTSATYTKITVKASTNSAGDIYARLGTSGSWTKIASGLGQGGGSATHTFTGLTPEKTYTVQVYAHRSYNGVNSGATSKTVSTKSITAPSLPAISISDITEISANLTLASGGTVYDSSSSMDGEKGQLYLNIYSGADYTSTPRKITINTSQIRAGYTVTDLEAGKTYGIRLYTIAPFGTKSAYKQIEFITLGGASICRIKTASEWVSGTLYMKTESGWVSGVAYIKTATGWKKAS